MNKHSKYKNSGVIYELLVGQTISDLFAGKDSPSVNIIKKYYKGTELAKEHKLYTSLLRAKTMNESKAESVLNAVLDASIRLNKNKLKREKYEVIKEIKEHYNVDNFFKNKINNYTQLAAIYNLIETKTSNEFTDPSYIINNKMTILEHISNQSVDENNVADNLLNEYSKLDKGSRILTYKIMLEKFNEKYSDLTNEQKTVLKEYINNISDTSRLRDFVNEKINEIKSELKTGIVSVGDETTRIKLSEVMNLIKPLDDKSPVKDENVISLLQYYQLVKEVKDSK